MGTELGREVVGLMEGTGLGSRVGSAVGATVGNAVGVGEGGEVRVVVGMDEGDGVGAAVGAYVTSCTPAPDTTADPVHVVLPTQPSWIR